MGKAGETAEQRDERIRRARDDLARRYAADPEGVERFKGRMANLTAVSRRQQQRVDHLVFEKPRPTIVTKRGKGKGKHHHVEKAPLPASIEQAVSIREEYSNKEQGTPETHDKHARYHHDGAIKELVAKGTLDREQEVAAEEIGNVYRAIESGVAVKIASLEARVDCGSGKGNAVAESVRRVRHHVAYTIWRDRIPAPKQLVLDMIVGDAIGYTVAAKRYGVHNRKAKRLLIEALDRWPACLDEAYRAVNENDLERANAA